MRDLRFVILTVCFFCAGCFDPIELINDHVFGTDENDDCTIIQNDQVLPEATPADFGLEYEDFLVSPSEGVQIYGWFILSQSSPAEGTVLVHGPSVGVKACLMPLADQLTEAHFNVVLYDYEGFGESSGSKSVTHVVPDAQAVLEWVLARLGSEEKSVAMMGISLGSGPSLRLAGEFPDAVWGVILDSAYVVPTVSEAPSLGGLLDAFVPEILTAFPDEMNNEANVVRVQAPLLMLHGTLDEATRIEEARALFAQAPNGVELVEFEAGHGDEAFVDPNRYAESVVSFLEDYDP